MYVREGGRREEMGRGKEGGRKKREGEGRGEEVGRERGKKYGRWDEVSFITLRLKLLNYKFHET